ncbi:ribosomal protein L11 methyltransferase [Methanobrevibacter cuticularis]|uniref:Ribosomal protein L11 methyltransferase n=1 Tax=Methanobrevibacter cuticularis TaxID=47311 RepID=A0A166FKY5_9EURY|nr:METTL5 family protein [Methanobrevibacter cuticularis]KZX17782.1 ribosomal protein L11 methyltransferase [Methanobrevibacter cuticularis]
MKISKKRHLEIAIESIPKHPKPKVELEQYSTPATIAADIIWNAFILGDIENKSIIDLGCGTGIFTIAPLLLGAKLAIGIDIDQNSIDIAKKIANTMQIYNAHFFAEDVYNIKNIREIVNIKDSDIEEINNIIDSNSKFDTFFANPPFGSQFRSKKGADKIFMELSMKLASVSYSFHMAGTKDFLISYYENLGGKITHEFFYEFPLDNIYDFHTQESKTIDVIVLRVVKD